MARLFVVCMDLVSQLTSFSSSDPSNLLLLQLAVQHLVGFGLLYDFVAQSSLFTLLSPISRFHLL